MNRRRNYFIKKKFQRKVIARFCILLVLGAVITGVILYLSSKDTVTTAFVNSRLSIVRTSTYILPTLLGSSLISLALIGIATFFVIMYLSHRIAGPLYKIEKSIREIGEGNLGLTINLRSTDEIAEIAASLNAMTNNIRDRISEAKNTIEDLTKQIDSLNNILKDNKSLPSGVQDTLKVLMAKKEQLNREIAYFKIS